MEEQMNAMRELVRRHSTGYSTDPPIPRMNLRMGTATTGRFPAMYQPMLCYVLQGSKHVTFGNQSMRYEGASYMIASVDLPVSAQIFAEGPEYPYLAVSLILDPAAVAELMLDMPAKDGDDVSPGVCASALTPELVDPMLRLLKLLDAPEDIPVLAPLIEREVLYRLIHGPQGNMLRRIAGADSRFEQIRRAIGWIRNHCTEPLRIEALADVADMSASSLHRHFKSVTAMSPLQYHKAIRLQEARRRLLAEPGSVTAVAYAVGYESPSQFSREYARQFGVPPLRDAARVREGRIDEWDEMALR